MFTAFFRDRRTLKNCKIYQMLSFHAKKRHLSFHTPGHKIGKWDITELSFSDNLSAPRSVLADAQKDIAQILGAERSFILTDGSTCGILSMLQAAKTLGVKTLLAIEPLHKSVYNACAVLGLQLITAPSFIADKALLQNVQAVLLTSPDYYGNVADLAYVKNICKQTDTLFLVDGAHGGHLHYNKTLHAGAYADMWVDGVHKSLPALTQGAVVSANERCAAALEQAVDTFRTTSPSYPIMASVEYAVKYPQNLTLENTVRDFAKQTDRVFVRQDYTKLCVLFGKNAFLAEKYLEKQGIYAEFCDGNVLCFYLSPAQKTSDFQVLKRALTKAFTLYPNIQEKQIQRIPAPTVLIKNTTTEWVELAKSERRICAGNCGLFPPCTPLLYTGEQITAEHIRLLQNANNVFGINNGKILVYCEQEKE